jgi:PST family polysaccharide transporter
MIKLMYKSKFFKNLSYLTLIQISNTLIPLFMIPYLARIISPENFGHLEFARYFCYFFTIVVNYSFDTTITRKIVENSKDKKFLNQIISQTFYAKFGLFLIAALLFYTLINIIPSWRELIYLLSLTFTINLGFLLFPLWFFQGTENLSRISLINFFIKIGIAILTIFLISENNDYWIFNLLQGISLIILGIISVYILYTKYGFKLVRIDFKFIKMIVKEGSSIFISTILITLIGSVYFLVLETHGTKLELGVFSSSNKISASLQALILLPFSQAFFPLIARQAMGNISLFKKNILRSAVILFIITGIIGLGLVFFGNIVIEIVFGSKYLNAFESLKVLAFLPMLMLLNNVFAYQGLLALKKDKLFLYIHIFATFLTFILIILNIQQINAYTVSLLRIGVEGVILLLSLYFYFNTVSKFKINN